jgi:CheY-like chemotaxis protein
LTGGLNILVCEDNALLAMDMSEVLAAMGHAVCAVASTEDEAVSLAARFKPDLMIVDAHLRVGSGVFAMRQILMHGYVPHFFVTGDPLQLDKLADNAIIVQKPFRLPELVSGIDRAMMTAQSR